MCEGPTVSQTVLWCYGGGPWQLESGLNAISMSREWHDENFIWERLARQHSKSWPKDQKLEFQEDIWRWLQEDLLKRHCSYSYLG